MNIYRPDGSLLMACPASFQQRFWRQPDELVAFGISDLDGDFIGAWSIAKGFRLTCAKAQEIFLTHYTCKQGAAL